MESLHLCSVFDVNGNTHTLHRGDKVQSISGLDYENLFIEEIFPLAHGSRRRPRLIHGTTPAHIRPIDRGHDAGQPEYDEYWGENADNGLAVAKKYAQGFMMNIQMHWSRAGEVMMTHAGDDMRLMGWMTVKNADPTSQHRLYRVHVISRSRG